jgi:hypothetical protein
MSDLSSRTTIVGARRCLGGGIATAFADTGARSSRGSRRR